jgi:hypothetical protein
MTTFVQSLILKMREQHPDADEDAIASLVTEQVTELPEDQQVTAVRELVESAAVRVLREDMHVVEDDEQSSSFLFDESTDLVNPLVTETMDWMDVDIFVDLYGDVCDVVQRAYTDLPVTRRDDEPPFTSSVARAAAWRIFELFFTAIGG